MWEEKKIWISVLLTILYFPIATYTRGRGSHEPPVKREEEENPKGFHGFLESKHDTLTEPEM